jgi:hypothetical protein
MIDVINFATENNIGIEVKPQDGSYRPLVGRVKCIVILKRNNLTTSITITETDNDSTIELALQDALRKLIYEKGE